MSSTSLMSLWHNPWHRSSIKTRLNAYFSHTGLLLLLPARVLRSSSLDLVCFVIEVEDVVAHQVGQCHQWSQWHRWVNAPGGVNFKACCCSWPRLSTKEVWAVWPEVWRRWCSCSSSDLLFDFDCCSASTVSEVIGEDRPDMRIYTEQLGLVHVLQMMFLVRMLIWQLVKGPKVEDDGIQNVR